MNDIYAWLIGIGAIVAGFATAYSRGKKAERNEQLKRNVKAREKADEVDKEMDSLSNDDIRNRGNKWVRNK